MVSAAVTIRVQRLPHGEGLPLPAYATEGSAGMDLRAAVTVPIRLAPLARCLVPTGLRLEIPKGFEGQVRPRSGLAVRQGLTVLNTPGTIDSDYRGEVQVILVNLGSDEVVIARGDRIAQLVIAPVTRAALVEVDALAESERGDGGFGHTGKS
ncbi:MAG: dUTP diphosphatase [Deltaproteobacteria bacterium]|nr:dUTP diphosphatase [Deltaproteobacteria bacterium]